MLKTVSSIVNAIGALNYKGTWNASTNTPTLASGVGTKGDYYVVSVAGTTNLDGTDFWGVGDWAVFNGSIWQRVEGGDEADVDSVNFNTVANVTPTLAELTWNNDDRYKTLSLGLANNDTLYVGQEQYFRIKASGTITKGQVVMFSGVVGGSGGLQGAAATGLTFEQSNYILGIAKDNLSTNDWGNVQYFGEVRGVNASGGAENWIEGQILYYDPTNTGGLTKTKPTTPNVVTIVAAVVSNSSSNGILFVRPTFGSALGGDSTNVNFSNVADNEYIVYQSSSQTWVNLPAANVAAGTGLTGGGLANANSTVTLSIAADQSLNNVTANNVVINATLTANLASSNTAAMPDPSIPLNPEGYITVTINGSNKKIPYYGV